MSNRFKDSAHLIRLGLLFILGLFTFIVIRNYLIPKSFGTFGFYRADALAENKSTPINYAGQTSCRACHHPFTEQKKRANHRDLACESCHGALIQHTQNPMTVKGSTLNPIDLCGQCHQYNVSRPKTFPQVVLEDHRQGLSCIECHNPHQPELNQVIDAGTGEDAGLEACRKCHQAIVTQKMQSIHQRLPCSSCHELLKPHLLHPQEIKPKKPAGNLVCGRCHNPKNLRPEGFPTVNFEQHSRGKSCFACHSPHHPELRIELVIKPSSEGTATNCITCHQKIETLKIKMKHRLVSCDRCHGTAAGHQSNPAGFKFGKIATRELCSRCHAQQDWRPKSFPQIDPNQHNPGMECVECHTPHEPNL